MTRRALLLVAAYAAIAVALLFLRPASAPGPAARDFEAYWSAGSAWNAGSDPYAPSLWRVERAIPGTGTRREGLLPFIGPPPSLVLYGLLARCPYRTAAALWLAVLAAGLLALIVVSLRASVLRPGAGEFAGALALAAAFGPATSDLALGQAALLAVLGAALLAIWANRAPLQAAAGGLLAALQPNAALGAASRLASRRGAAAVGLSLAGAYLIGARAAGWSWPALYAQAAIAHGVAERFSLIQITPAAIAYGFGAAPAAAAGLALAIALLAVGVALRTGARIRNGFARFAAWSALLPFVSGFWHEHDLVAAYPAALWCGLRAGGALRSLACAGSLLIAVDWLGLAQRPSGIPQSALLAVAAACAFAALRARGAAAALAGSVPAALLFAAAAALAAAHPAPVWPAVANAPAVRAGESAAAIWLGEQRASGLLAQVWAWSVLRVLSLLGCALLVWVIYRRSASGRTA